MTLPALPLSIPSARGGVPILRREDGMQFSRLADDYLKHLAAFKGYSPHTVTSYDAAYRQFGAYLVNAGLTDDLKHFTDAHVMAFAEALVTAHGKGTNTVRHRLGALSSLARYGMKVRDRHERPRLDHDPTRTFDWPTFQRPTTRFLYRDELRAFLEQPAPLYQAIARACFVETGLRLSELIRANVEDLVEGPRGATLSVTVKGRGRREERVHTPLSPELVGLLKDWLLHRTMPDGRSPLLTGPTGARWTRSGLGSMIWRLARAAGITRIQVRPHVLRHTANVIARSAGLDPYVRAKLLHHESPRSLERYEHLMADELHQARERTAEGLARYLGADQPEVE